MTLYTAVARNKRDSGLLILIFILVVIAVGWAAAWLLETPLILFVAVIIAVGQAYIAYYHSDSIALALAGARPLSPEENISVHRLVENLAITAGLPKPSLFIIDEAAPNAFATGRDPEHASIAVTRGLLDKLDKPELEGVLAHELAHIGNLDIRLTSLVVVLVGLIAILSDLTLRGLWWRGGGRRSSGGGQGQAILMILGLVLVVLAPLIATLIQLAISRRREFLADSAGALLTRYPEGLARALNKIASDDSPLLSAHQGTAHLYFANPLKGDNGRTGWLQRLFLTHPPVEERVAALLQGGGVHHE